MTDVTARAMLDWLERQPGPEALAIRDRMRQDAAELADLQNDCDEFRRQVKEFQHSQQEAAWLTR